MDRFQIVEVAGTEAHAGTKATADVASIAEGLGFKSLYVEMRDLKPGIIHKANRQLRFCRDWSNVYKSITEGSIVLLQHPFHYPQITRERTLLRLKQEKRVHFISIVHDVEELRTLGKEEYHKREFDFMLRIADVLVVHNKIMKNFFLERGVSENKIVILGIFDYLRDDCTEPLPDFDKSVTIAGNLDVVKSGYLAGLGQIGCRFNLYGPHYTLENLPNITYGGVLPPDQIPSVLTRGFGLIWDGNSVETCKGGFGDYLRYNNPHKLSLYLSSGLPVFIWKYAAEAEFVESKKVGYLISSLMEIPQLFQKMTEGEYKEIAENVRKVSKSLVTGEYMKVALSKSLELLAQ